VLANISLEKQPRGATGDSKLILTRQLPDLPIKVLHRTDGRVELHFFPILSKLSQNSEPRSGKKVSPKWPVGAAFSRCQDLVAEAAKTSGAIGYAELRCGEKIRVIDRANSATLLESCEAITKTISDVAPPLAMEAK